MRDDGGGNAKDRQPVEAPTCYGSEFYRGSHQLFQLTDAVMRPPFLWSYQIATWATLHIGCTPSALRCSI